MTVTPSARARIALPSALARALGLGLATLLVLATHWEAPIASAPARLDPSYMQATGMALAQRLRFGVDVLFTFGPLGWFNTSPEVEGLYWTKIVWELVVRGALVLLLVGLSRRLERRWERVLFMLALILPAMRSDSWWFLAAFGLLAWDSGSERDNPWREGLVALGWTLIGLVKFTFLLFAGLCGLLAVLIAWRMSSGRTALRFAALQLGVFAIVWLLLGQSLLDLPAYVRWSLELTRGYSEGMSLPIGARELAWAGLGACACLAVLAAHLATQPRSARARLTAVLFLLGAALAFKAGYVRNFGAILFFGYVGGAPYLLAMAGAPEPKLRAGAARLLPWVRTAALAVAIGGNLGTGIALGTPLELSASVGRRIAEHLPEMFAPWALEQRVQAQSEERRRLFAMPRTRARIGAAPVEVFGSEHAVLYLNDLHWKPRLVPFAFSVLTAGLAERNERDLAAADAPRFVLLRGGAADGRLPTSEDGPALRRILCDYAPVDSERGFLVLERRADAPRALAEERLLERRLHWGETLDLEPFEGACLVLRLDLRPTTLGTARTLCFQAVPIYAQVETSDGRSLRFRVVPEMLRTGAIVAPLLEDHDAWVHWVLGERVPRILRLTLLAPEPGGLWEDEIGLSLTRADGLVPHVDPALARDFRWSMFVTPPRGLETLVPARRGFYQARDEVLVVGAPSRLLYDLEAGRTHVVARYGFQREALGPGSTDGAVFRLRVSEPGAAARVVFERRLDPLAHLEERSLLELELDLDVRAPGELAFEVDPGPAGDARGDATYWTAIELTRP